MTQVSPFASTVTVLAQEQVNDGPQGPEFGKAAPVGLLVIVALLVAILVVGWFFNRRMKKMKRRQTFAELHGLDPFDIDTIDRRMAEEETLSGGSVHASDATLDAALDSAVGDSNRLYGPDAVTQTIRESGESDSDPKGDSNGDPNGDPKGDSNGDSEQDSPRPGGETQ